MTGDDSTTEVQPDNAIRVGVIVRSRKALLSTKVIICLAYVCLGMTSAWFNSPTYDEVGHLPAGLAHWQLARFEPYAVNPPLLRLAATFPLYLAAVEVDPTEFTTSLAARSEFKAGRALIHEYGENSRYLFFVARVMNLLITLVGLLVCMNWAADLFGYDAAAIAGILWSCNPMILGHAALVTPDVGAASLGILAFYQFKDWLNSGSGISAVVFGVAVGLCLSAKFTWGPVIAVVCTPLVLVRLVTNSTGKSRIQFLGQGLLSVAVALFVVNCFYGFDRSFVPLKRIPLSSASLRPHEITRGFEVNRFSSSVLGHIPVPVPQLYVQGIDFQKRDFEHPWDPHSYLMGHWKVGGWYDYYLIALLVKTPVPTIIAAIAAACLYLFDFYQRTRGASRSADGRSNRYFDNAILISVPLILLVLVSSQIGFNRHLRYLLPAYPFAIVLISRLGAIGKPKVRVTVFSLIALSQIAVITWSMPHWIEYFNIAAGGSDSGRHWLLGSNLDWGQDLLRLKQWQSEHQAAVPMYLAIDTLFDPADLGLRVNQWPRDPDGNQMVINRDDDEFWVAASVDQVMQRPPNSESNRLPLTFGDANCVDRVGYTIYIYHFLNRGSGLNGHKK